MKPVNCGRRCTVMSIVLAAASGALFGAGLLISGMTQPAKVVGFLDVTRSWDPSLAFVIGGAIAVYAVLSRLAKRRSDPWLDVKFHLPTRNDIDVSLIVGSALFGIGWGLGGLCPGPGLVAAASGSIPALAFVGSMIVGMLVQHRTARAR
ncbi:MAG: rane protein [Deltaproteobacteria bacterium]|nr:rane protein [Deltaproteobacteria bacterium]